MHSLKFALYALAAIPTLSVAQADGSLGGYRDFNWNTAFVRFDLFVSSGGQSLSRSVECTSRFLAPVGAFTPLFSAGLQTSPIVSGGKSATIKVTRADRSKTTSVVAYDSTNGLTPALPLFGSTDALLLLGANKIDFTISDGKRRLDRGAFTSNVFNGTTYQCPGIDAVISTDINDFTDTTNICMAYFISNNYCM